MFEWLGTLLERFDSIFPCSVFIRVTHGGVLFGPGEKTETLGPGLHWHWPFWSEVEVYPTARTTMDLPLQTLTVNGHTVIVSASLTYKIRDIQKAFVGSYDIEDTINNTARAAIADHVRVYGDRAPVALSEIVAKSLTKYGVTVSSCVLTDYAKCKVIRNVCDVPEISE